MSAYMPPNVISHTLVVAETTLRNVAGPSLGIGSHFGLVSMSPSFLLLSALQNFMEPLLSARPGAGVRGTDNSFSLTYWALWGK